MLQQIFNRNKQIFFLKNEYRIGNKYIIYVHLLIQDLIKNINVIVTFIFSYQMLLYDN